MLRRCCLSLNCVLVLLGWCWDNTALAQGACCGLQRARTGAGVSLFKDEQWQRIRHQQFLEAAVAGALQREQTIGERHTDAILQIVGGVPSKGAEHASCVAISFEDGLICTGTLVAPQIVIAAAHCLFDDSGKPVKAQFLSLGNCIETPVKAKTYRIRSQHAHPDYLRQAYGNDIAVLILDVAIESITPCPIASDTQRKGQSLVTLVGYRREADDRLKQFHVRVPFLQENVGRFGGREDTEFVAGEPQHAIDACQGDTGGPAFIQDDGQTFLAGITSRSMPAATQHSETKFFCADGGIYTRPDAHQKFLHLCASQAGVDPPRFTTTER